MSVCSVDTMSLQCGRKKLKVRRWHFKTRKSSSIVSALINPRIFWTLTQIEGWFGSLINKLITCCHRRGHKQPVVRRGPQNNWDLWHHHRRRYPAHGYLNLYPRANVNAAYDCVCMCCHRRGHKQPLVRRGPQNNWDLWHHRRRYPAHGYLNLYPRVNVNAA